MLKSAGDVHYNTNEYIYISQNKLLRCTNSGDETSKLSGVWQTLPQTVTRLADLDSEFQMTVQETAKSLAPITVRIRRTTSFRVSADLKCRLL